MSTATSALARTPGMAGAPARRSPAGSMAPGALVRVVAFSGLAIYGVLRWGTLLAPVPTGRLLGLVVVAVALAAGGPAVLGRSRILAALVTVVAAVAMLIISGLPWTWIRHLRFEVSSNAIGDGLSALPRLLVPYRGPDEWVRMVLVLGAAVLLFDAALMMAFAMGSPAAPSGDARTIAGRSGPARGALAGRGSGAGPGSGDLRRAVAALPLIALATVPLTLVPAHRPYLQGLLVFGLLAALVWGERLTGVGARAALLVCGVAGAGAMVLAPGLSNHRPWIDYQSLASGIGGARTERFDWSQRYGPLNWPRLGHEVLEVQARQGDYWKAINLDVFNGTSWIPGVPGAVQAGEGITRAAARRWTQTVTVTIRGFETSDVIGPGDLGVPGRLGAAALSGASPGRWIASSPLGPGDSYVVRSYSPHPSPQQLAAAGTDYPSSVLTNYLSLTLPVPSLAAHGVQPTISFPPFGAPPAGLFVSSTGGDAGAQVSASVYARAFELATRLRAQAPTPYAFTRNVLAYLARGFVYDENPPASSYPLESFLFAARRGYCQQFAGAMAVLLRMGGVPARVAAGFTTGQFDPNLHRWLVADTNAHAWVEAFFPGYGWIRFDPTPPGADPALQNLGPGSAAPIRSGPASTVHGAPRHREVLDPRRAASPAPRAQRAVRSSSPLLILLLPLLGLAGSALWLTRPLRRTGAEALLRELERAFARTGRPLPAHVTLSELERRVGAKTPAGDYVRGLSAARYGDSDRLPGRAQRRALRAHLGAGLGVSGAVRALWALPPRWRARRPGLAPLRRGARGAEHRF